MSYADPATPTGDIVTGTNFAYIAGSGRLKGISVTIGASGTTTAVAYDNAAGDTSGKVLFRASVINSAGNVPTFSCDFDEGILFLKGLSIVITGNGICNSYFCAGG